MDSRIDDLTALEVMTPVLASGTTSGVATPVFCAPSYGPQAVGIKTMTKFSWTAAEVVALGDNASGEIDLASLPKKTLVSRAFIVLTAQGTGATGLTVSLGYTATDYVDLVVASDANAATGTVYGLATGELGTALDSTAIAVIPSLSAATTLKLQFVATTETLKDVTATAGDVYIETVLLP